MLYQVNNKAQAIGIADDNEVWLSYSCSCSSPVALVFEPVVEINPLPRDTATVTSKFTFLRFYLGIHISTNPFGMMNSWVNCAPTVLVQDWTQASGFIVRCANHCTTKVHFFNDRHGEIRIANVELRNRMYNDVLRKGRLRFCTCGTNAGK